MGEPAHPRSGARGDYREPVYPPQHLGREARIAQPEHLILQREVRVLTGPRLQVCLRFRGGLELLEVSEPLTALARGEVRIDSWKAVRIDQHAAWSQRTRACRV